ncbi:MAG TPA: hypothetical protein VFG50_16170 [Rhodothermales bacterium]|nr:hypothetical protein [Rhodothermales bacterium]
MLVILGFAGLFAAIVQVGSVDVTLSIRHIAAVVVFLGFLGYLVVRYNARDPHDPDGL